MLKLPTNRVRRNYTGGAGIDKLHKQKQCLDNDKPEEWVGSMEEASNPGLPIIPQEGLAFAELPQGKMYLKDLINTDENFYLGDYVHGDGSWQLSFLLKILDSAMRLHVQAHPTTEFANRVLHKPYGKLECYYILSAREGIEPYIRLGFQHAPTKEEWRRIIQEQDMAAMDACFEKIPVATGEVWCIPGGMPHAIGEGLTMLEIMEPSDLVVRCEFEREGIVVPPEARFMGKDLDFCLDIFDYHSYSPDTIKKQCRITPEVVEQNQKFVKTRLVGPERTPCFSVEKIQVMKNAAIKHEAKFTLGVVCAGSCLLKTKDTTINLEQGNSYAIAAAVPEYIIEKSSAELVLVQVMPGEDMKRNRRP